MSTSATRILRVLLVATAVVAGVVLDVAAAAPVLHQITVLVGAAAVYSLIYANRRRVGWTGRPSRVGEGP